MRSVMLTYHVSFICCVCVWVVFLLCLFDCLFTQEKKIKRRKTRIPPKNPKKLEMNTSAH
jgi:hypothetical protein